MNSLKGGVVPREGLEYIAVGRDIEIKAILHDVEIIEDGGAAFRFIMGKYGSGKSFMIQIIRTHVLKRGFVVLDADLSPDRRLVGNKGQGLATYRELIQNMSTKARPEGGALPSVLEKWISSLQMELVASGKYSVDDPALQQAVSQKIFEAIENIQDMVHGFEFAKVITHYWDSYKAQDVEGKNHALKWLRGEYSTKGESKRELGVNVIITDDNWYEYIKLMSAFLHQAGYKGVLVMLDELINLYKLPNTITRQTNYEKILTIYNDALQGKVHNLGIIMCGTPQTIEDPRRGLYSYEALRSRLEKGKFSSDEIKDMLAPVIKLNPLTYEELTVLIEKLAMIHASLYDYPMKLTEEDLVGFLKIEFGRVGTNVYITPREIIRDFIEVLNVLYQNPALTIQQVLGNEAFSFAKADDDSTEELQDEFKDFTL